MAERIGVSSPILGQDATELAQGPEQRMGTTQAGASPEQVPTRHGSYLTLVESNGYLEIAARVSTRALLAGYILTGVIIAICYWRKK